MGTDTAATGTVAANPPVSRRAGTPGGSSGAKFQGNYPPVEARLLKGKSVNQHLLAAASSLQVVRKSSALRGHGGAEAIQKSVLAEGGLVLASKDAPASVWAIRPTGDLLGVLSDSHPRVAAKGAGALRRSRSAGRGFSGLATGGMVGLGSPAAVLVTPLARYFDELARAYGGAAEVLIRLGKTIDTGDMRYMVAHRSGYFRNLGRHLTNAMGRGFVRGWAESAAGAGIGRALPTGAPGSLTNRTANGLIATNLALPEEFGVFGGIMKQAMNAVTVPTR